MGTKLVKDLYRNTGIYALVVANGPSAKNINWNEVLFLQKNNKLKLFVVNSFHDIVPRSVVPDYLVLSDPETKPTNVANTRIRELWKRLQKFDQTQIISPIDWHEVVFCQTQKDCLHFDDRSLEGISHRYSPLCARGYPTLTAYKGIAYALHFGFERIFLCGLDNSNFKNIFLDQNNDLIQGPHHAVDSYSETINLTRMRSIQIEDYFYDLAYQNFLLRRCFPVERIINLSHKSFIDIFSKLDSKTSQISSKLML